MDLDRWDIDAARDHAQPMQVLSPCFHPAVLAVRACDMLDGVLRYALEKPGGCWITTNQEMVSHTLN